jgi:hypothetical protein
MILPFSAVIFVLSIQLSFFMTSGVVDVFTVPAIPKAAALSDVHFPRYQSGSAPIHN